MKTACFARNTSITYVGKTPVELVFGRRPRDVIDPETSTIEQLTTEPSVTEAMPEAEVITVQPDHPVSAQSTHSTVASTPLKTKLTQRLQANGASSC